MKCRPAPPCELYSLGTFYISAPVLTRVCLSDHESEILNRFGEIFWIAGVSDFVGDLNHNPDPVLS